MSERHEHWWRALPLEMGQYVCDCGVTGRRGLDGRISEHKKPRLRGEATTARPRQDVARSMGQDDWGHRGAPGCGRVAPKKGAE